MIIARENNMSELNSDFVACAHCQGSGTCKNGENESSCSVCAKKQKLTLNKEKLTGLVCSVCGGLGALEPKTARIHNRIVPLLAMLIVYFALSMVLFFYDKEHFNEVLAFAATLIGSVTGYYFGGKSKS